jgi:hypothetical protein
MTVYEIGIMTHYYAYGDDHPDILRRPPIWEPTIDRFLRHDLLALCDSKLERVYDLTDRGRVYVEALKAVPLPQACWRVEWPASDKVDG